MSDNEKSFKENYQILKEIADNLQRSQEPDIDQLVEDVQKATIAYQACKSRIASVQKVVEEHLSKIKLDDSPPNKDNKVNNKTNSHTVSGPNEDEDFPF